MPLKPIKPLPPHNGKITIATRRSDGDLEIHAVLHKHDDMTEASFQFWVQLVDALCPTSSELLARDDMPDYLEITDENDQLSAEARITMRDHLRHAFSESHSRTLEALMDFYETISDRELQRRYDEKFKI